MDLKPYRDDFEVLEDYKVFLSLLKKAVRRLKAAEWEYDALADADSGSGSVRGGTRGHPNLQKCDLFKASEELGQKIHTRLAVTREEGISLRIDKVASRYKLNELHLDIVLILAVEELAVAERPITLSEIVTAFSQGNLEKTVAVRKNLDRMQSEDVVSMRALQRPMHVNPEILHELVGVALYECPGEERTQRLDELRKKITAPRVIYDELNRYVVGQEKAKRVLSVGVYNHVRRVTLAFEGKAVQKSNILLIGPTGTGKTYIVKILARFLNLPLATGDSTSLTEAGYVGDDVEILLWRLLETAGGNEELAEIGIVFLDEVDKLAGSDTANLRAGRNRDVGGTGVQQALLKLMEGTVSRVPEGGDKWGVRQFYDIRTDNILFIMAGAFTGLDGIVRERLRTSGIGFQSESDAGDCDGDLQQSLSHLQIGDLVNFGMLPEFVGRLPVRVSFCDLSEDDLRDILKNPQEGPITEFESLFEGNRGKIRFTEDGIRAIAREALKRETGARALREIVEKVMAPIIFEGVNGNQVVIDEDSVYCALRQEERRKNIKKVA